MDRGNDRKTPVILLVDDDPADQELTRRGLQRSSIGNDLRTADDGQEALDYLQRRGAFKDPSSSPRPDLVLLDLNMPRIDGKGVLAAMRQDPDLRTIPVVILTTSAQEIDVERSYELGANSYITKPVSSSEYGRLLSTIEDYWFDLVVLPPKKARRHG